MAGRGTNRGHAFSSGVARSGSSIDGGRGRPCPSLSNNLQHYARRFCDPKPRAVGSNAFTFMRIFVTGASGLVGRQLVPRLLRNGMAVTVLVRTPGALDEAMAADLTV